MSRHAADFCVVTFGQLKPNVTSNNGSPNIFWMSGLLTEVVLPDFIKIGKQFLYTHIQENTENPTLFHELPLVLFLSNPSMQPTMQAKSAML